MTTGERSRFTSELNAVLETVSMSAEDIVDELNKCGFPLPLHTFNYWLQGYFLPRSSSAFQLVAILESVCGVTNNRLADALLHDLSSGASFVPGDSAQSGLVGSAVPEVMEKRFSGGDSAIDWEANLIQKAVRDEIVVSADHKYLRHKTTVLARVPAVPNPTFVFQIRYAPGEMPGSGGNFYDLSGITLRTVENFEDNDGVTVCSAQFALPDDVVPGDLHSLSYSCDYATEESAEKIGERFLPWILDFYSCKVIFEGEVPDDIRYITFEIIGDEQREIPCDIPLIRNANTVSISTRNVGNRIGAFYCSAPRR